MGRPRKYATKEEAKAKMKENKQKFNTKVKNDPVLHEKEKAQKRNSQAKRIANMTPEEKKAYTEYNTNCQKALKAGHLKQFQQQVSSEQAEQLEFFTE